MSTSASRVVHILAQCHRQPEARLFVSYRVAGAGSVVFVPVSRATSICIVQLVGVDHETEVEINGTRNVKSPGNGTAFT
jgi:hypothetical protein